MENYSSAYYNDRKYIWLLLGGVIMQNVVSVDYNLLFQLLLILGIIIWCVIKLIEIYKWEVIHIAKNIDDYAAIKNKLEDSSIKTMTKFKNEIRGRNGFGIRDTTYKILVKRSEANIAREIIMKV